MRTTISLLHATAVSAVPVVLSAMIAASCSAGSDSSPHSASGGGGGNNGEDGSGATAPEIDANQENEDTCVGAWYPGDIVPLDVYILLDATASMNGGDDPATNVWTPVVNAITDLVADTMTKGIGVGLTYLPVRPPAGAVLHGSCRNTPAGPHCSDYGEGVGECGCPLPGLCVLNGSSACDRACGVDADCGLYGPCKAWDSQPNSGKRYCEGSLFAEESCDPQDYGGPIVPIAELPGNQTAITQAISSKNASGKSTPSQPALEGTFAYLKQWALDHPDHIVHLLFATDGEPNTCTYNSIEGCADVVSKALTEYPHITTFVLGIGKLANLDAIAVAGGTGHVYLADGATVSSQLVSVFNEIRANGACQFLIPEPEGGQILDYERVNVYYTPLASSERIPVSYVPDASSCDPVKGGWYYDDPMKAHPTRILLCPATCDAVQLSEHGVDVELGCKTIIL